MEYKQKQAKIEHALNLQNVLFNPAVCPARDLDFEYVFNEDEGLFVYHLAVRNKQSSVRHGYADSPVFKIETTLFTLQGIMNGVINPPDAIRSGKYKVSGNVFFFQFKFRKLYGGSTDWRMPAHLFKKPNEIGEIKKVFVLNCSPRGERGATAVAIERLVAGMEKAGAQVDVLCLSKMKINPCVGCFKCWVNNTTHCVFHEKDDMKLILEKYWSYDLMVWATPVYHYFGTTAMKTVMDRLFINADPHFIEVDGEYRHPRKVQHIPNYALLAVGAFPAKNIFDPLRCNFETLSAHTGIKLLGAIYRHTCMPFIRDEFNFKKKEEVLSAIETAGQELVALKRIKRSTKKQAEKDVIDIPVMASMVNHHMDVMQEEKRMLFQRELKSL